MDVIYDIKKIKVSARTVLVIGVFDGLHIGHQALIRKAVAKAKSIKGQVIVLTFFPHPVHVLRPDIYLPLIVSLPHRLKLIEYLGVKKCIVVRFTKAFSRLSPKSFIEQYLMKRIRPKEVFVGDDFRFGQNRSGSLDFFKQEGERRGFRVNVLHSVKKQQGKIGSTAIRQLIMEGQLQKAARLLGRDVSIMGKVIRGDSRGKRLGFPTANIDSGQVILPPIGVYAVRVILGAKVYEGMANIGHRPSFHSSNNRINVEVHIFDLKANLYGKEIIVEFIKKIRDERIFFSEQGLIKQLEKDEVKIRALFKKK